MTASGFPVEFAGANYDLRQFVRDHPGGVNTLKYYKGKSILKAMEKFGHSSSAYHMLNDFKLNSGELLDVNLTGSVSLNGRIITNAEAGRNVEEIMFLEELEARLDWSKPLLRQLDAIAPHYHLWVNSAVYRKCRLFESPVLESMTYTAWYLVPACWVPIILYLGISELCKHVFCGVSCTQDSLVLYQYVYHIFVGLVIWTVLEYSLHRWVFHLNPGSSITMIKIHFLIHGMHHKVPFDGLRQVFPPVPAFLLAYLFYIPLQMFLSYPLIKFTGGLIGYLTYDMIHYYVHHGSPKDGTYLYAMKRYHSNHHFVNHDKGFGISSKIWDYVFKTFVNVRKLGFSLHW
ncbi:fatty acid 2-hydroxylase [Galleria mellonella]|uniref:Fatty acid 2-hydroxylase n=1 Tax=Galleria mellonella TaxID=7137 RepID=A0ABM3MAW3_GALME|nr:fatty acid 2-hydroxylase [Galleria mellonella]